MSLPPARFAVALGLVLGFAAALHAAPPEPLPWERPTPFAIAHRGAHLLHPENSISGIVDAPRIGATLAEIDLRTTSDGYVVLMHDTEVDRTTDGTGSVWSLTFAEIRALHLRGPDGKLTNEIVPTFAEALEAARGRVALYVDVKAIEVAALASWTAPTPRGSILVYIDHLNFAEAFHKAAPGVPILFEGRSVEFVEAASRLGVRAFASDWKRFTPELARAGRAASGVFLVDSMAKTDLALESRTHELLDMGALGIQTDDPTRVMRVVAERAQGGTRPPSWAHVAILGIVQGATELLPVSSSAHVIFVERLLGLDPSRPELALLLVVLHAGTMLAVVRHFWARWRRALAASPSRASYAKPLVLATALTGVLGLALEKAIETLVLRGPNAQVEPLWRNLPLVAVALMAAGVLILATGLRDTAKNAAPLTAARASVVGLVQALCLPFRGFSRTGATVSAGLLAGLPPSAAEELGFALAVLLAPPVIALELHRFVVAEGKLDASLVASGGVGMALSFASGSLALRVFSRALEKGRFWLFGLYAVAFGGVVLLAHFALEV